jgi:hypothetical protein
MDPVSALGVAAAVVQFADFGYRFIKNAAELYNSGEKAEYIELSNVSQDLSRLADAVGAKLGENKGPADEIFCRLRDECLSTNEELQSKLVKVRTRVSLNSSRIKLAADGLRAAFNEVQIGGDIDKLADRLKRISERMNVTMLHMLLSVTFRLFLKMDMRCAYSRADIVLVTD